MSKHSKQSQRNLESLLTILKIHLEMSLVLW